MIVFAKGKFEKYLKYGFNFAFDPIFFFCTRSLSPDAIFISYTGYALSRVCLVFANMDGATKFIISKVKSM